MFDQAVTSSSGSGSVVVGMDLTLGYVYKLVLETFPLCRNESVRCFLFDDEGYLVVHPGNLNQPLVGATRKVLKTFLKRFFLVAFPVEFDKTTHMARNLSEPIIAVTSLE